MEDKKIIDKIEIDEIAKNILNFKLKIPIEFTFFTSMNDRELIIEEIEEEFKKSKKSFEEFKKDILNQDYKNLKSIKDYIKKDIQSDKNSTKKEHKKRIKEIETIKKLKKDFKIKVRGYKEYLLFLDTYNYIMNINLINLDNCKKIYQDLETKRKELDDIKESIDKNRKKEYIEEEQAQ